MDLNLLVAFDTLLRHRSVTKAGESLNLSQAAMSAALHRLRVHFSDDILVAHGKRMYPTAFAQNIGPQIQNCLKQISAMLGASAEFDPKTSNRAFRIVASDYITAVVLAPVVAHLADVAPRIRTEVLLPSDNAVTLIENGDVDLLITPEDYVSPDLPTELLYEERHVVVGCKFNGEFTADITEEEFFAAGHVIVEMGSQHTTVYADRMLEALGKARRIEVVAPSFTAVPWLLINTKRLSIMHERLAIVMARHFSIAYHPLPLEISPLREMVQYHYSRSADSGLTWFRRHLYSAANEAYPPIL